MKIFYFSNSIDTFLILPNYKNRNKFFDILDRYSISYGKEKGTSSDEDVPLCPIVTNYRTFIDDMYKVLEFAEWVKEMGDFALFA